MYSSSFYLLLALQNLLVCFGLCLFPLATKFVVSNSVFVWCVYAFYKDFFWSFRCCQYSCNYDFFHWMKTFKVVYVLEMDLSVFVPVRPYAMH